MPNQRFELIESNPSLSDQVQRQASSLEAHQAESVRSFFHLRSSLTPFHNDVSSIKRKRHNLFVRLGNCYYLCLLNRIDVSVIILEQSLSHGIVGQKLYNSYLMGTDR